MVKRNVHATRMELSRLKKRLEIAERGHKLLKDKQDELMRRFIALIKKNKQLRQKMEKELKDTFQDFLIAASVMPPEMLEGAISFPKEKMSLEIFRKNVMGVVVPAMKVKRKLADDPGSIYPYGFVQTAAELDDAIAKLYRIIPVLLELTEVEKACQLMADEIEKTRRRVNALEYRTIPGLEETIKIIRMKLDENERGTITRLIKVKDIINK